MGLLNWAKTLNPATIKTTVIAAGVGILIVAAITGFVVWKIDAAFDNGFAAGGEACRAEVANETAANLKKSQGRILNAARKTQSAEDKINAAPPGADGVLAPVLRDQLRRMRLEQEARPSVHKRDGSPRARNP